MKINVVALKMVPAEPQHEPRRLEYFSRKGEFLVLSPTFKVLLNQVQALSAFLTAQNRPVIMFFLRSQKRPFVVDISRIDFAAFMIDPHAKASSRFRDLIRGLCKHCPGLIIDKSTYAYVKGESTIQVVEAFGPWASTMARKIQTLAEAAAPESSNETVPPGQLPLQSPARSAERDTLPATPLPLDLLEGIKGPNQKPDGDEDLLNSLERTQPGTSRPAIKMTCPKCGKIQPQGETCQSCGVLIQRYLERHRVQAPLDSPTPLPTPRFEDQPVQEIAGDVNEPDRYFLSVESLLKDSFQLARKHWMAILGLSFAISIPLLLFSLLPLFFFSQRNMFTSIYIWFLISFTLGYTWLSLAISTYLDHKKNRGEATIEAALLSSTRKVFPIWYHRLGSKTLTMVGLVFFFVPGIFIDLRFFFMEQAATDSVHKVDPYFAFNQSSLLVRGRELTVTSQVVLPLMSLYLVSYLFVHLVVIMSAMLLPLGMIFIPIVFLLMGCISIMIFIFYQCLRFVLYQELWVVKPGQIPTPSVLARFVLGALSFSVFIGLITLLILNPFSSIFLFPQ